MTDYSEKELQELYEGLPEELEEAFFSEETADKIYNICIRNNIKDEERVCQIAKYAGYVLLGIFPPDEFQENLEKEVKLTKTLAKKIASEINRFIFFPLKDSLEALYKTESKPSRKTLPQAPPPAEKPTEKDKYREALG